MEPKYYYNETHNQAVKVTGLSVVFVQAKQWTDTEKQATFWTTALPDEKRLKDLIDQYNLKECTEKAFLEIVGEAGSKLVEEGSRLARYSNKKRKEVQ